MKHAAVLTLSVLLLASGCAKQPSGAGGDTDSTTPTESPDVEAQDAGLSTPAALQFEIPTLAGEQVDLSQYQGQVVLIVNTASECGLTPQYEQLQQLHEQYGDQGLAILGFPANNFGAQEPGSDEAIAEFCEQNFGVGFDMFAKISVKGDDQHPLYAYLTSEDTNPGFAGEISWNFEKFLLGRDGQVVARFEPRTRPDAPEVLAAIQAELTKTDNAR